METNNEILRQLLLEKKIKTHIENKELMVKMKYEDLIDFCIKLLKLEAENEN